MRRVALVSGAAILAMLVATPAMAGELTGGCTLTANSGIDATNVIDATQADPFEVDANGTITYKGTSPGAITNHTWFVWVDIGGNRVTVASDGSENADMVSEIEDTISVAEGIDLLEENSPVPIGEVRGIYLVGGSISGTGGACTGNAYVRVLGSPLESTLGLIALALILLGLIMMIRAAFVKRPSA